MCSRIGRDGPIVWGRDHRQGRAGTGQATTAAHGGLRTPGTDGHMWLASSVPGMHYRQVLRQTAGQQGTQEMVGAKTGGGGPEEPVGDELYSGGRTVAGDRPAPGAWNHPRWHVPDVRVAFG